MILLSSLPFMSSSIKKCLFWYPANLFLPRDFFKTPSPQLATHTRELQRPRHEDANTARIVAYTVEQGSYEQGNCGRPSPRPIIALDLGET
jgi:hypothetical protein